MTEWKRGIFQPKRPLGYLLRSKLGEMNKPRFYINKPKNWNQNLFDLIPVYEVIAD